MNDKTHPDEAEFLKAIDTRLNIWQFFWNFFLVAYFGFGVLGILFSTLAASKLLGVEASQWLSLGSGPCIAIIGFLRPEPRYKNIVRAWRDLKAAKEAYLFQSEDRKDLLIALQDAERKATEDESQDGNSKK